MSDTNVKIGSSSFSLGGLVFLVLLILKLTGTAVISWFWVFFPLWIGLAVLFGILATVGLVVGFVFVVAKIWDAMPKRRMKR